MVVQAGPKGRRFIFLESFSPDQERQVNGGCE